jgi:GGDEF domain-containing protein
MERLDSELKFAQRHETAVSLLMLDLDHFKKINDTQGHLAGDRVLSTIASVLIKAVRNEDVVARFGGEEFVIILRAIALDHAQLMAERMRKLVAVTPIVLENGKVLRDGSNPYALVDPEQIGLFPITAGSSLGSVYGYATMNDLAPLSQWLNLMATMCATLIAGYGAPNLTGPVMQSVQVQQMVGGGRYFGVNGSQDEVKPLNLLDESAVNSLLEAMKFVMQGKIRGVVDRVLPLSEARQAHELIEDRAQFGKVILAADYLFE